MARRRAVPASEWRPGLAVLPRGWNEEMWLAEQDVLKKLFSLEGRGTRNDGILPGLFEQKLDALVESFRSFKDARQKRQRQSRTGSRRP